jgi:hypothetical protein
VIWSLEFYTSYYILFLNLEDADKLIVVPSRHVFSYVRSGRGNDEINGLSYTPSLNKKNMLATEINYIWTVLDYLSSDWATRLLSFRHVAPNARPYSL